METVSPILRRKMADSVLVQTSKGRFVGGHSLGRIHKGHGTVAASSSIPSKYQTIVLDNSERKGFLSKAKRFQESGSLNDNPGPGSYKAKVPDLVTNESPSLSKRGTGTFASKMVRFDKEKKAYAQPGPGEYQPVKPPIKSDFNKAHVTSNFHAPIAIPSNERNHRQAPAPNSYKISKVSGKVTHDNNVSAYAAFKSGSKRENCLPASSTNFPSPCHYEIKDTLTHKTAAGPSAPFKSTTERKMVSTPDLSPGPGSYNPFLTRKPKPRGYKFQRQHYLSISAPALPLPQIDPQPGPGHYNLVNYDGEAKRYMSSSMFVSTTSRWDPTLAGEVEEPGPTSYRPRHVGKQSFIYNPSRKWIL